MEFAAYGFGRALTLEETQNTANSGNHLQCETLGKNGISQAAEMQMMGNRSPSGTTAKRIPYGSESPLPMQGFGSDLIYPRR